MKEARPVYRYLLIVAIIVYVIGVCLVQVDLYNKTGELEHQALHAAAEKGAHGGGHEGHE
jgi:hypothetical protein